ncbi:MAG: alpha/beta hydrolase [Lachnospiraceae bacterium]|nr:alpha/beta hydrolase [Lachnospiraceae bacterium]
MTGYLTDKNTLNEVLSDPRLKKLPLLFDPTYYEAVPPSLRKMWLKNIRKLAKTPRGSAFPVDGLLKCANFIIERREKGEKVTIPLYKDGREQVLIPFMAGYSEPGPCVIIVPGGAYHHSAVYREGIPAAEGLQARGITSFILGYDCSKPFSYPKPLEDMASAILFVRKNAEKLNIDPGRVYVMGFSAGGHLAAAEAALYNEIDTDESRFAGISKRPDGLMLAYPVISFREAAQKDTVKWLLGEDPSEELLDRMSIEKNVTGDFPPAFVWCCRDDATVDPRHTELLKEALDSCNVLHNMQIYESGGHAICLGEGTSAAEWLNKALDFFNIGA